MMKRRELPPDMAEALEKIKPAFPSMLPTICLSLLREEPLHGYEIMKRGNNLLERNLNSKFELSESIGDYLTASNTYPALHKMEKQGLIKSHWEKRKRYYSITPKGIKNFEMRKKVTIELMKAKISICKEMFNEEVI